MNPQISLSGRKLDRGLRGSVYDLWVVKQSWQLEKPQSAAEHPSESASEAASEAGRVAASEAQRVSAFFKLLNCFQQKPG